MKPELLLPAGNPEAFAAAIDGGADAVYLGIERFNARNRAINFKLFDLVGIVDYAHKHDTKVYLTLNTLIKNNELGHLANTIHMIGQTGIDAIIMQDWAVYSLVKRLTKIDVHASTQMGFHNSAGGMFCENNKIPRMILAREVTIPEINGIRSNSKTELEAFVHGSLCYSFSGKCLFSSYCGGMSANRGQCRQPCRRIYQQKKGSEYLFSLKDLEAIEILPELMKLGVTSLKIEGRMKRPEYVYRVAKAYRMVLDDITKIEEAKLILQDDYAREKTGYFLAGNVKESIGSEVFTGKRIGEITKTSKDTLSLVLDYKLEIGNLIRVRPFDGRDAPPVKIKTLVDNSTGDEIEIADSGMEVTVKTNDFQVRKGEQVYLVADNTYKPSRFRSRNTKRLVPLTQEQQKKMITDLKYKSAGTEKGLYLRIEDQKWLDILDVRKSSGEIMRIEFDRSLIVPRLKASVLKNIWLELPYFIAEEKLNQVSNAIDKLVRLGYYNYCLSSVSQKELFPNDPKIKFITNEKEYCLNDLSIDFLQRHGMSNFIYPFENDFPNLNHYKLKTGIVPVYFYPDLFISRMPVYADDFKDTENKYHMQHKNGITHVLPTVPVAIFNLKKRLQDKGYKSFLIDLSNEVPGDQMIKTLLHHFGEGTNPKESTRFNFKKGLW
ncbi:MAG: peptidase U32 family protein [Candidatus Zophobacter franzmannii]|nr:peptidase U32 family protein [Candidatus Zophobacter franzmannii]